MPNSITEAIASYFGFEVKRPNLEEKRPSFAPKVEEDGAVVVATGGSYGTYVDLDGSVRSEAEVINKYRDMALHGEIDTAINHIINEAIISEQGKKTVQLNLDEIDFIPDNAKQVIHEEFSNILELLEFNTRQYDVFRRWLVDGRLYYHIIIDPNNVREGIQELRYLDPRKIRKIREVTKKRDKKMPTVVVPKTVNEYYLYSDRNLAAGSKSTLIPSSDATVGIKIAKDSILYCGSGMTDTSDTMVIGYLHKAIRPLNLLRILEDAVVIYAISRAPERRIFYVDVGSLPKIKAEQYIREMMNKHKNRLVYNSDTGEIKDDRKFMTMQEDYWLARREGGRGTEVTTLQGGQQLGQMDHVTYFLRKLYKALDVPISRMEPETVYNIGRTAEISRDEIAFSKFIDRMRTKFNVLFEKALEKQLILKMIVTPEEWELLRTRIRFVYLKDNYFTELKESEILAERLTRMDQIVNYIGRFYSNEWVRKNILKQTEEEMLLIDQEIMNEQMNPQYNPIPPGMPGMEGEGGPGDDGMGPGPADPVDGQPPPVQTSGKPIR